MTGLAGLLNRLSKREFRWPGAHHRNSRKLGWTETQRKGIARRCLELPWQCAKGRDFIGFQLKVRSSCLGAQSEILPLLGSWRFPQGSLRALVVELQPAFLKEASTCNGKTYNLGSTTSFGKLFPWLMHLLRNCYSSLKEFESSAGSLPALLSAAA